eukprot:scaffold81949_cov46-Phaeocystis_antarctica.AAC.1
MVGNATAGLSARSAQPSLAFTTNPHVAFLCRRQRRASPVGIAPMGEGAGDPVWASRLGRRGRGDSDDRHLGGKLRPELRRVSRLPRRPSRRGRASHLWPTRVKPRNTCPTPPHRSPHPASTVPPSRRHHIRLQQRRNTNPRRLRLCAAAAVAVAAQAAAAAAAAA